MAKKLRTLPKKWAASLYTFVYLACQLVFLLTTLGNMPALRDTIKFNQTLISIFDTHYMTACLVAGTCEFIIGILAVYMFIDRRWPTLLTLVAGLVNFLVCILAVLGIYILDLRNVYFTLQVTFAIPVIAIFLSSVFLIDDTLDLLNDRFEVHMSTITSNAQDLASERKEKFLSTQRANLRLENVLNTNEPTLSPEETTALHLQSIAAAAEIALPGLTTENEEKTEE